MKEKVIIVGAGDYAISVIHSIDESKYDIKGFLDDNMEGEYLRFPIIGKSLDALDHPEEYKYFISIANIDARKKWFKRLEDANLELITVIDKTANVATESKIGKGTYIGRNAVVGCYAVIGCNCMVYTGAIVEYHCYIGNHVRISPGAVVNGHVDIEDEVYIGANACIVQDKRVRKHAVVGAGAVVISDVDIDKTVVGVPARII